MSYPTYTILSTDVLDRVENEIRSAREKHGKHTVDHEGPDRAVAILTEEVGEVAKEALEMTVTDNSRHTQRVHRARLKKELAQVAAVAIMWLEGLNANE